MITTKYDILSKDPSDCDECRNVRDGPYCRAKCPEAKYANASSGICEPCDKVCKDGCTGPGNHLGLEGCNDCHLVMELEKSATICLQPQRGEDSQCPDGFFYLQRTRNILTQNGTLKIQAVTSSFIIAIHSSY